MSLTRSHAQQWPGWFATVINQSEHCHCLLSSFRFSPNMFFYVFVRFTNSKKCVAVQQWSAFFFFDRWHVLTSKLADISCWLQMDSRRKVAICCNMLHRLRQGASAFKGHRVARWNINKGAVAYVRVISSSLDFTYSQELTWSCHGDTHGRNCINAWRKL